MDISKKDVIRFVQKMGEALENVEWLKQVNRKIHVSLLQDPMISAPNYGENTGRTGPVDSVGNRVIKRQDKIDEIAINERRINQLLQEYAAFARMMDEILTADEKNVIWERHALRQSWSRVARFTKMSRSGCFRAEDRGIEKLQHGIQGDAFLMETLERYKKIWSK